MGIILHGHRRFVALAALFLLLAAALLAGCGGDDPAGPLADLSDLRIVIDQPMQDEITTSTSDTLSLAALVSDETALRADVDVRWASDQAGVLGTAASDDEGRALLTVTGLPRGDHVITATVVAGAATGASDQVLVHHVLPARVSILAADVSIDGVALRWSANRETTFAYYDVRRWTDGQTYEQSERVQVVAGATDTTLVDPLPPLADAVHYAVTVIDEDGLASTGAPVELARPNGPILPFLPWDVQLHPTEPIVYVLQRAEPASRLVAMNYLTREVVADASLDFGFAQYLEVADAGRGVEVFVTRYDDGFSVLDALTLEEVEHVSVGYSTSSVAVGDAGRVYVSLGTGAWGTPPTRCYDRATWQLLDEDGHYWWTRLESVPGGDVLLEVAMSIASDTPGYYLLDADGTFLDWDLPQLPSGVYVNDSIFRVDPSGRYVATHHWGSVFTADAAFGHVGNLPRGASNFYDYAFSDDGGVIHAADSLARHARSFLYPSLAPTTGYSLRGYPVKLRRAGEYLVALSKPTDNAEAVGLDVVRIAP
jgi:hypothetical protein